MARRYAPKLPDIHSTTVTTIISLKHEPVSWYIPWMDNNLFARGWGVIPHFAIGMVLTLSSCGWHSQEVRIHSRGSLAIEPEMLRPVFDEQSGLKLVSASLPGGMPCVEALAADLADLCLEDNSAAFVEGVRAVLPIYQSVLHVFMRDGFEPTDPERPLKGTRVHVLDSASAGLDLVQFLADRQGLKPGDYTLDKTLEPGEPDVILYLGPIDPLNSKLHYPGYQLVSADSSLSLQLQLTNESLSYTIPNMVPVMIPRHTYDLPGNDKPVQTVAVDTLLLTRKAVPDDVIYRIAKALVQQKPRFTAISPHLFAGISESFDPLDLSFPLHDGARRYLEREEPGLIERYAEMINMLAYVAVMLVSGFLGLARWRARRKKDRIDVFYLKVLDIRARAQAEDHHRLLQELLELEKEAFASLIAEKLAADESFRIFTDLLERVRLQLK
jgi:predicted nucleic acid-binding protein